MNNLNALSKNIDKKLCVAVALLATLSVVMIGSITVHINFFSRSVIVQIVAYIIGILIIFFLNRFPYNIFRGQETQLYIFSIILLLLVYIPGLGVERMGSRAWINLKIMDFQPSEIVKITFIVIMAGYLEKHRDELYNFRCLMKSALFAAPIILIVLKEDLGSAAVFSFIWITMVFAAGIDSRAFIKFVVMVLAIIPCAYPFLEPYQQNRIEAFLHPDNLSLPGNYQVWQSKVAIGSGGFWGKGLFHGTQKELDFIPIQSSDFIFSVIGEELGFIGGLAVICLLTFVLIRMMHIAHESQDFYGSIIVSGIIGMFGFQIFENIAMSMGMMPVTGLTLPFISYGGSSIISNMTALAFVLSIGARSRKIKFS